MKGRNTLFLIQKSLSLAVFCLSCLCWSPWQQQLSKSILLSPAQIQPGVKISPCFQESKKTCHLPSLPFHCHPLFHFFFSFWCIWAGANLSLFFFFRKQQREICFIFRRLSRQPNRPYCMQVGMIVRETCQEKPRPRISGYSLAAGHACLAMCCGRAAQAAPTLDL